MEKNKARLSFLISAVAIFAALSPFILTAVALADDPNEEIAISNFFIPSHGYDDNDNIQVTLDVQLPDPCYVLSTTSFDVNPASKQITLHAFAWRRNEGVCERHEYPEPSNVTVVLPIGQLVSSKYSLVAKDPNGMEIKKSVEVAVAKTTTLDDLSYAQVTNIVIREFYAPTETIKATITGRYNPTCERVNKKVDFWVDGDVIVALPTTKKFDGIKCVGVMSQFDRTITIGKLPPNAYLMHVRSKNGMAENHLFSVLSQ